MTSVQKPCSRCRCVFAFGPVAYGAAFGNAFGKSTVSIFCCRFFPVKQLLSWPSVMPRPVAFGKAFGKSTVTHFCFRFLCCQEDPAEDVSHCGGYLSLSGMLSGKLTGNQQSRIFAFGFSAGSEILSLSLTGPLPGTLSGNQQYGVFAFGFSADEELSGLSATKW